MTGLVGLLVGLKCPFSFYKFVVSTSVLLYSGYKMTVQQPMCGGFGRVCKTGVSVSLGT